MCKISRSRKNPQSLVALRQPTDMDHIATTAATGATMKPPLPAPATAAKAAATQQQQTTMRGIMPLADFYKGQEIFITGGSGFVGKVLIEKIMRSLSDFSTIYVLLRGKKGKTADERLEEILSVPLFRRVRHEKPESFKRVIAIAGDCKDIGLGISPEDLKKLQNVTLIFHAAACVRFDDDLKPAILLNTRGTHELMKIAEKMPNLQAFIHVSTTYAHPNMHRLEEKVYPSYADWRTTIKLAETYDTNTLNIFFPKYSDDQPNTYTFTKSLAESVVDDYRNKLPICIVRLSIVINSVEDPFPGWIDNFNGPVGMLVACAAGIMRTDHADPDVCLDFIPVDLCVRALLLAAYDLSLRIRETGCTDRTLDVINCANSNSNAMTIGHVIDLGKEVAFANPMERAIWLPEGGITRCIFWHYIRFILLQIIPAVLLDLLIKLANHEPFLMKLQRRILTTNRAVYVFLVHEWTFITINLKRLENLIPHQDYFNFSIYRYVSYNHMTFFENSLKGAKEFLLKEPRQATRGAVLRMYIFKILHHIMQALVAFYVGRFLLRTLMAYMNAN